MKRYISDELPIGTYAQWLEGAKVIINAPTGSGKTTFILREFLPYCASCGKKVLILCNRRLLKIQYGYDLAERYERYEKLAEHVEVCTYQALSEQLADYPRMQRFLNTYEVVVCDEVHYFYADSDFNGAGTYILLQALVLACFFKTLVLVTATLKEVQPLLIKTFERCREKLLKEKKDFPGFEKYCWKDQIWDFAAYGNYERFTGIYVREEEAMVKAVLSSEKKALIFIDDKNKADSLKKLFLKIGKLESQEVYILTAETLEMRPNDEVVRALAITHKVLPRILITTSVLDNGVSIHDAEVGSVVIATESRVSFLQMLGRVRAEAVSTCKLYIFPRSSDYYEKRIQQYEEKMRVFESMEQTDLNLSSLNLLQRGWHGSDERAEALRKATVLSEDSLEYYGAPRGYVDLKRGEGVLAVNAFAKEKAGNMLLAEKRFYKLAMQGFEQVAIEQISWLGKAASELTIIESCYREEREKSLHKELLKIQGLTTQEFSDKKKALAKEYRQDMLSDVVAKNGSFSREKFEKICERFKLQLHVSSGADKRNRYTVREVM